MSCQGTKKSGEACGYKASVGDYCKIHAKALGLLGEYKPVGPCVTITFCDVAENHVGMEQIGELCEAGFSLDDITFAETYFQQHGCVTELIHLNTLIPEHKAEDAYLLIVRDGVSALLRRAKTNPDDLLRDLLALKWDKHALMKGKVKNKRARHNVCFGFEAQAPDYEHGKGRIVDFADVPALKYIQRRLHRAVGEKGRNLVAEGNLYYDASANGSCGIGFHGDAERNLVVAVRLGSTMPLQYHWYLDCERIGSVFTATLNHGDLYIMSAKAVGKDWRKRLIPTLRHAAGSAMYLCNGK